MLQRLLLSAVAAACCCAQTLQITAGPKPYQVLQRDPDAVTLRLEGTAQGAAGKNVEVRIIADGRPLAGFDWRPVGQVGKPAGRPPVSKWSATIAAVPAGGPYLVCVRVAGSAVEAQVGNILVGDLWVLAGQSNMEGVGNLEDTPLPAVQVNSFDQSDVWVPARDPLHSLPDSADQVHWRKDAQGNLKRLEGEERLKWIAARKKGAGVGLPFALEMVRRTGVPIGLIPCAHGGTSMDQWSPELKSQGGASLYGATVRRVQAVGGKVKGILWYQGESDANPTAAPQFEAKFKKLIEAFRADFNQPSLPFYYVQIGRHVSGAAPEPWFQVQDAQRRVETALPDLGMTTGIDLDLDDGIHVGTDSMRELGRRVANLATAATTSGPRPQKVEIDGSTIRVVFEKVNGRLKHTGRLNGFAVHGADGKPVPMIFRQRLSAKQSNVVELLFGGKLPENGSLSYGFGRDPYLNLVDEAGMPAVVFGPMPLPKP